MVSDALKVVRFVSEMDVFFVIQIFPNPWYVGIDKSLSYLYDVANSLHLASSRGGNFLG